MIIHYRVTRNNYTRVRYEDTSSDTFAKTSAALSVTLLILATRTILVVPSRVEIPLYIRDVVGRLAIE